MVLISNSRLFIYRGNILLVPNKPKKAPKINNFFMALYFFISTRKLNIYLDIYNRFYSFNKKSVPNNRNAFQ